QPVGGRVREDAVFGEAVLVNEQGDPVPREELASRFSGLVVLRCPAFGDLCPDVRQVRVARRNGTAWPLLGAYDAGISGYLVLHVVLHVAHGRERTQRPEPAGPAATVSGPPVQRTCGTVVPCSRQMMNWRKCRPSWTPRGRGRPSTCGRSSRPASAACPQRKFRPPAAACARWQ